jgi:hypothetical protein
MRWRWSPMVLLIFAAGCSGRRSAVADAQHDPEKAREALVAALDSWKNGEARRLPKRVPPIRFDDPDFAAGWRLAEYELQEPDATIRPHADVAVILSVRDPRGKALRRETAYQVSTEGTLAVLSSDP